jgi:hypothetical protein
VSSINTLVRGFKHLLNCDTWNKFWTPNSLGGSATRYGRGPYFSRMGYDPTLGGARFPLVPKQHTPYIREAWRYTWSSTSNSKGYFFYRCNSFDGVGLLIYWHDSASPSLLPLSQYQDQRWHSHLTRINSVVYDRVFHIVPRMVTSWCSLDKLLHENSTIGRCWSHFEPSFKTQAQIISLMIWFTRSVCPLVWGWYAELQMRWVSWQSYSCS